MFTNKAFALVGERDGLGLDECSGDGCAVATITDIGLAIVGLIVACFFIWVFEILSDAICAIKDRRTKK